MKSGTVGLVGLGLVGNALAFRLIQHGFHVIGYDVDPAACEQLQHLGGKAADGSSEVAAAADRVLLSLPNTDIVSTVLEEMTVSLRPGHIIVDTTTGEPELTAQLGARLSERGIAYLDATISGSSQQLRLGEVIMTVGGDQTVYEACRDLFEAFSRQSFHVGPCGSGAKMKLITNLVLGLNRAVLAEAMAFAKKFGLELSQTLAILKASPAYSCAMDVKGQKMIDQDFEPQARLTQHLKDVNLMLESANSVGAKLPFTEVHQRLLAAAEAAGLGQQDNSAILRMFD